MKRAGLAWMILGSMCLLAGCGGAGGGEGAVTCATQADCDDGRFCTGTERCENGVCLAGTPPCSDADPCTEDVCTEFVQTCRQECAATGLADPCCDNPECVDSDNCPFSGGSFQFHVTGLNQQPANCVIPQGLLNLLLPLLTGTIYPVNLPPESAYPISFDLNLPFLDAVSVPAEFRSADREIFFGPVLSPGIDLGAFNIPGLNCLVGGSAEGVTNGLTQTRVPLLIAISEMSVGLGGGTGACSLTAPAPTCVLEVALVGVQTEP